MEDSEVRSHFWMSRRAEADSAEMEAGRSERREERREERSLRPVATMGRVGGVVRRRCRVRAWPMPREEGVTSAHAIVVKKGRMRRACNLQP